MHHLVVYSDELYMICHFFADSIYTERYMVTPDENEQGYKVSILLYHDNGKIIITVILLRTIFVTGLVSVVSSQPPV